MPPARAAADTSQQPRPNQEITGQLPPEVRKDAGDLGVLAGMDVVAALVEWVAETCRTWGVEKLLTEGKASGITAAPPPPRPQSPIIVARHHLNLRGQRHA